MDGDKDDDSSLDPFKDAPLEISRRVTIYAPLFFSVNPRISGRNYFSSNFLGPLRNV